MNVDNHLKTGGERLVDNNKVDSTATFDINPIIITTFQELKIRRKHRFIIINITDIDINIENVGERDKSFEDMTSLLPFTMCRYIIYDYEYETTDGRKASKIFFINWMPSNATPHNKMSYASAKGKLRDMMTGVFDAQASNIDELAIRIGIKKEEEENDDDDDF